MNPFLRNPLCWALAAIAFGASGLRAETFHLLASTSWNPIGALSHDATTQEIVVVLPRPAAFGQYTIKKNGAGGTVEFVFYVTSEGIIQDADEVTDAYSRKSLGTRTWNNGMSLVTDENACHTYEDFTLDLFVPSGELMASKPVQIHRQYIWEFRNFHTNVLMTWNYRAPNYSWGQMVFTLQPSCAAPCASCGMATYSLEQNLAGLVLQDRPLGYASPLGSSINLNLSYHQLERRQPVSFAFSNLGPQWNLDWVTYITHGFPNARMQAELFTSSGVPEVYQNFNYVTKQFAPQQSSRATLAWKTSPDRWERTFPSGGIETYGHAVGTNPNKAFLLTERKDAFGNTVTFTYDAQHRLTKVTDAIGRETTLAYELTSDPLKITKVTDPFGRYATLAYDSLGRLVSITDVIGIVSSFTYEGSSHFISSLTTPYGVTKFERFSTSTYRRLVVTDPQGDQERVEYQPLVSTSLVAATASEVPSATGLTLSNSALNQFNSFYWDKKAMKEAKKAGDAEGSAALYAKAKWRKIAAGPVGVPVVTKEALEERVWFMYKNAAGNPLNAYLTDDALPLPAAVARLVENGSAGAASQVSWMSYNSLGRATETIDPLGRKTKMLYATNNVDLTETRQVDGSTEYLLAKYENYTNHLPQKVTDAAGAVTETAYNAQGQPLTITRKRTEAGSSDEVTAYAYYGPGDPNGPQGALKEIDGPLSGASDKTTLTYDSKGRTRTVTDSEGYATTTDYDHLDRVTKVTYPNSQFEETTFDRLDVKTTRDRQGRLTTYWHNALRQLVMQQDPEGRVVQYAYCRCGEIKMLKDAEGRETWWRFDVQGRLTKKIFPGAGDPDHPSTPGIAYTYEPKSGRLSTMTDLGGNVTTYKYQVDGSLGKQLYTEATGYENTPDVEFSYDGVFARRATMIDGQGTTTYGYHAYQNAGGTITVTPGAGDLASIDGPVSGTGDKCEFIYDELGRVKTKKINGTANSTTLTYDPMGRITQTANNLGTFTQAYVNATSRLASVTYPNGQKTEFAYWANTGSAGNSDQRLKQIKNLKPNLTNKYSQFDYEYAADGQITKWLQENPDDGTNPVARWELGYDEAWQLTSATIKNNSTNVLLKEYLYAYDKAGNRLGEEIQTGSAAPAPSKATFNALNQITQLDAGIGAMRVAGSTDKDTKVKVNSQSVPVDPGNKFDTEITASTGNTQFTVEATDFRSPANVTTKTYQVANTAGGVQYWTYDTNGNTKETGFIVASVPVPDRKYKWDALNRLVEIEYVTGPQAGHKSKFEYDGLSRRYRIHEIDGSAATISDKRLLWCGHEIAEERDASGNVVKRYYPQGVQVPGASSPADKLFYTRDHLGSIRELTDNATTPAVRARYAYDPYGRVQRTGGTPEAVSGSKVLAAHQTSGELQYIFKDATQTISPANGEKLFVWVHLDPINMPREIMLKWNPGNGWEHRAYWGEDLLPYGTNGTNSRRYMGPLPPAGGWVRLEVPAFLVGVHDTTLSGMSMSWHTGRAWFDRAGKLSTAGAETVWFDDALPTGATLISPSASTASWTDGGIGCDFAFTGHYRHAKSGLHLALYRAYDAGLGRWLSRDPIEEGGGINLYGYCGGNPVYHRDALGLSPIQVGNCEVVLLFAHGSKTHPFVWAMDPCSAAGVIGCWPASTGKLIPPGQGINGLPSHNDEMLHVDGDGPLQQSKRMTANLLQESDDPSNPNNLENERMIDEAYTPALRLAIQKARDLCQGCCKAKGFVTIKILNQTKIEDPILPKSQLIINYPCP